MADRLTVGVAARLSRYLQVLTQAKKMGKDRISSQEISDYTNINATQIRRDLSAFGKFGKRGVGYNIDGKFSDILPTGADALEGCGPVYEEMPGWKESTVGVKDYAALPPAARNYLERIAEICEVPVDMVSTGPDRDETIVLRHPFEA